MGNYGESTLGINKEETSFSRLAGCCNTSRADPAAQEIPQHPSPGSRVGRQRPLHSPSTRWDPRAVFGDSTFPHFPVVRL